MTIALPLPKTTPAARGTRAGYRQAVAAEIDASSHHCVRRRWIFAITAVGTMLVTFLSTNGAAHHPPGWYSYGWDPTNQSMAGLAIGSLVLGVLGVLTISGEYGSGTMRSTLAAVPRRETLFAAKATVLGLLTLVVGEILSFAAFFFGQAILSAGGAPYAHLGTAGRTAGGCPHRCLPEPLRPPRSGPRLCHPPHGRCHRHLRRRHPAWPRSCCTPSSGDPSKYTPAIIFAQSVSAVVPQTQPGVGNNRVRADGCCTSPSLWSPAWCCW